MWQRVLISSLADGDATPKGPFPQLQKDSPFTPSLFGMPKVFTVQMKDEKGLNIYSCNRPVDQNWTPLALLSPIFGDFQEDFSIRSQTKLLDDVSQFIKVKRQQQERSNIVDVFEATRALMYSMSKMFEDEKERQAEFNNWLRTTFGATLEYETAETDRHEKIVNDGQEFLVLITEGKNEIGTSGEPHMQGMAYYRFFYGSKLTHPEFLEGRGCLPAILISYHGMVASSTHRSSFLMYDRAERRCVWHRNA